MSQQWANLTDKQKKKFGSKKDFKAAKKEVRASGANITSAKQIVKQHKSGGSSGGGGGGNSGGGNSSSGGGGGNSAQTSSPSSSYNYGTTFGKKDLKKMQAAGYSDAQIKKTVERAGVGNVKASIQRKYGVHGAANQPTSLDDYDVDSMGRTNARKDGTERPDLQKAEVKFLLKDSGFSASEINDWAKQNNYTFGSKAQSFLNKRLNSMTNQPPTDVTDPGDGTPVVDTKPEVIAPIAVDETKKMEPIELPEFQLPDWERPDYEIPDNYPGVPDMRPPGNGNIDFKGTGDFYVGRDLNQNIGKTMGDQDLDFTNNGTFIGNNNQGADYSVTIGMNNAGNSVGGYNSNSAMMDNIMSGAALGALNDNAYHKSQSQLSGSTRGAQDVYRAEAVTGSTKRSNQLRYNAALRPQYWQSRAAVQSNMYLGDMYNMRAPSFVMPKPYKAPENNVEDIADDYN